jgi:tetrahydromethanopterin S-methyltransferase subunit F
VPARVERLLSPPGRGTVAVSGLALGLVSGVLILLPVLLAAVARA